MIYPQVPANQGYQKSQSDNLNSCKKCLAPSNKLRFKYLQQDDNDSKSNITNNQSDKPAIIFGPNAIIE